jgi:hypothetical protein
MAFLLMVAPLLKNIDTVLTVVLHWLLNGLMLRCCGPVQFIPKKMHIALTHYMQCLESFLQW